MKHLLSIEDLDRRRASTRAARPVATQFVDVLEPARHPEGPGAAGQDGGVALLRGLDPHPARRSRPRPSASRADTMTFTRRLVVGEEGREPARHGADHRGDGHRRDGRAPPGGRRAAPRRRVDRRLGRSTPATAATSTDPGAARRAHAAPPPRRRSTGCAHRDRRRRPPLAGRPQQRAGARTARCRGHARRAADAAARIARRLAGAGDATTSTTCSPRSTSSTCCASSTSASGRRCSRACASTPRATGSPRARAERLKPDALVMHPGPMNRGVEIATEVADGPRVAGHRAGRQRRRGAHGRALTRSSDRGASALPDVARSIRGGRVHRRDRRARRPTCSSATVSIVEVGARPRRAAGDASLDADGCVVAPGLVDLHVHLREPGDEEAETIETGARAAALGGFTAVVAMPNTTPPLDDAAVVERGARDRRRRVACATWCRPAASPRGAPASELAPMGELYDLGVRIFTDDGDCVADAGVMRRALEYAASLPGAVDRAARRGPDARRRRAHARGRVVEPARHPRPPGGGGDGDRRPRPRARRGSPAAGTTSCTCSTAGTVELVRAAKARGLPVTAEVAPHHFTLTDACCAGFDPVFKVNPPLRTDADVARRSAPAWPTARSTRSPPTTRRTRPRRRSGRSRRRRPGCSGSRPRSR